MVDEESGSANKLDDKYFKLTGLWAGSKIGWRRRRTILSRKEYLCLASKMDDEYYNLTKCGLVWELDYECYKYTKRKLASKLDDEDNGLFMDNRLFLAQD